MKQTLNPFHIGDLAVCLNAKDGANFLYLNGVYRVCDIQGDDEEYTYLVGMAKAWHYDRFRKFRDPGKLIETWPMATASHPGLAGSIHHGKGGSAMRHVVVWNADGPVFDSGPLRNLDACLESLETWLRQQPGAEKPVSF